MEEGVPTLSVHISKEEVAPQPIPDTQSTLRQ